MQGVLAELRDLAGHLDAGRAGADDDEREPLRARRLVLLDLGRLEGPQDAITEIERAFERLQLGCVLRPVVVPEVRVARAPGDDERVVVEGLRPAVRQVRHRHAARIEVEAVDFAQDDTRVALPPQDLAERHCYLGRRERSGGNLVRERLEEIEVLPVDERHLDVGSSEAANREQPSEATTDDNDLLH